MVGIVILGHGTMAEGLLSTCNLVIGPQKNLTGVVFKGEEQVEDYRRTVAEAAESVDDGDGVLFVADLKGGTPCNTAAIISYQKGYRVVSGVNVPMLVAVLLSREGMDLEALTELAKASAVEGVEEVKLEL